MTDKLDLIFDGIQKPACKLTVAVHAMNIESQNKSGEIHSGHTAFIEHVKNMTSQLQTAWGLINTHLPFGTNQHSPNYKELRNNSKFDIEALEAAAINSIDPDILLDAAKYIKDPNHLKYLDDNQDHFNWVANRAEEMANYIKQAHNDNDANIASEINTPDL